MSERMSVCCGAKKSCLHCRESVLEKDCAEDMARVVSGNGRGVRNHRSRVADLVPVEADDLAFSVGVEGTLASLPRKGILRRKPAE